MIKKEWHTILHSPWMIIVLLAILLIPSMYSTVFLGSMWDPYGNTAELPVAVVNKDEEVQQGTSKLHIGKDLAENLKENDAMDFRVTDEKKAEEMLKNGDVYMTITIPEEFSKRASALLDEHPEKMVLEYTTNPAVNYIASKMDDSAIASIKEEVSASVTKAYAKTIFQQIGKLSDGFQEAADAAAKLADGNSELLNGNQSVADHLRTLSSSTLQFQNGTETIQVGLAQYTEGVDSLNDGASALYEGTKKLNSSAPALSSGIGELQKGAGKLQEGIRSYTSAVSAVASSAQRLNEQSSVLQQGTQTLSESMKQLKEGSQQTSAGLHELSAKTSSAQASLEQYTSLYTQLQQTAPSLASYMKENGLHKEDLDELLTQNSLDEATYQLLLSKLPEQGLPSFEAMLFQMQQAMADTDSALQQLDTAADSLKNGTEALQAAADTSLVPGIHSYTDGVSQLQNALTKLEDNKSSLLDGSSTLKEGMTQLQQKTPALLNGIKGINEGAKALSDGSSSLAANSSSLLQGSAVLNEGALQLHDGAEQLAAGSLEISGGLTAMDQGIHSLNTALTDGAKQSRLSVGEDTLTMFSSPIQSEHKEISAVQNNGHAMAPYMMSVALYVAGMAFVLMYPLRQHIKEAKNGLRFWLSKASVMYSVSTLAAILLITALRHINGFAPAHLLQTYLFAILVSAAFLSLITFLNLTTGFIGDFLLLVFMIFNLGGSAGTYPLETSASFYQMIHPFVPFTYTVDGFRKTISFADPSLGGEVLVCLGILIVCSLLTILYFQKKNKEDKHLLPQAFAAPNEE